MATSLLTASLNMSLCLADNYRLSQNFAQVASSAVFWFAFAAFVLRDALVTRADFAWIFMGAVNIKIFISRTLAAELIFLQI